MTNCSVTKRYHFEAGHFLPKVPEGHKCARQHGHNYKIEVMIYGTIRDDGMVLDFFDLDKVVAPLVAQVDHRNLNDIEGLENPTAELIAVWFQRRILAGMPATMPVVPVTVRVYETDDCWAGYPA